MYGYVYETTNLTNGKKYIGQHKSDRFDEKYKGSGLILKQAIDKDGKDNFKVKLIEECETPSELDEREKYWINYYNAVYSDKYYNIAFGGNTRHGPISDEQKKRLSECAKARVGDKNPFYGKHHTKETIDRIQEKLRMYRKSKDYIDKLRSVKGKTVINNGVNERFIDRDSEVPEGWVLGRIPFTQEHKDRIKNSKKNISDSSRKKMSESQRKYFETHEGTFKGKKHKEESIEKMRESSKRENLSDETRKHMSEADSLRNLGKVWVNDGVRNRFVLDGSVLYYELLSSGYSRGRLVKFQEGKIWITDGFNNTRINEGDIIPDGWRLGLTIRK